MPHYSATLEQQKLNDSIQCIYTLSIRDITPKEAGNYACIFIWYEGYYHYEQVTSEVAVVQRPDPVYPICSKKLTKITGENSLGFVCESEQTTTDGMTLQWRNGNQILPSIHNVSNGMMRAKYLMNSSHHVIPNDTHEYVCEIMYKNFSFEQSCTIQATMGVVINSQYHYQENPVDSYATFTCEVTMSIPGVDFKRTWYYHDNKIDTHDIHDRFLVDIHAGELHVRNVTKADKSEHIKCLVTSILGNGSADAMMVISGGNTGPMGNSPQGMHQNTTLIASLVGGAFALVVLINVLLWFVKGKAKQNNKKCERPDPPSIDTRPPLHPAMIPYDAEDNGGNIYQYAETPYMKQKKCTLNDDYPYLNTAVRKLSDSYKLCSTEDISQLTLSQSSKNDYINMNNPPRPKLLSNETDEYESMYEDTEPCSDSGRGSAYSTDSVLLKSVESNHQYYQTIRTSAPLLQKAVVSNDHEERRPTLPKKEGKKAPVNEYQGLDKACIQNKDSVYMKLKKKQKQDDAHIYENIAWSQTTMNDL